MRKKPQSAEKNKRDHTDKKILKDGLESLLAAFSWVKNLVESGVARLEAAAEAVQRRILHYAAAALLLAAGILFFFSGIAFALIDLWHVPRYAAFGLTGLLVVLIGLLWEQSFRLKTVRRRRGK